MIGFDILQPEEIPEGASLAGPFVSRVGPCPEDVLDARVMVLGEGFTIIISQYPTDAPHSELPELIEINGVQGSIGRERRGDVTVTVAWADTERRFRAHLLGSELDEASFLEILESIPE